MSCRPPWRRRQIQQLDLEIYKIITLRPMVGACIQITQEIVLRVLCGRLHFALSPLPEIYISPAKAGL
jgi:hypothetical protein